jgi:ribosomal protein S18 acetylase RimI-like enzyme
MLEAPEPHELDGIVAFITAQQARPDRRIGYLGEDATGIAAELDGFQPPWSSTVRVVRAPTGGGLAGVVAVEWDEDLGRSWIIGPWVADDVPDADDLPDDVSDADEAWTTVAGQLVDGVLAQLPSTVTRHEMCGEDVHRRLAALAEARGWHAGEANHVLVADAGVVAGWNDPGEAAGAAGLRCATTADAAPIAVLHDAEFPDTYASAAQLVEGQLDGSRLVLVADLPQGTGGLACYAAGEVHDDGEGYIDYLVVDPAARRSGLGRHLVMAIARRLLAVSSLGRVALTVQDHRAPARALYESLGFRPAGSIVGYRSWTGPQAPGTRQGPRLDS